MKEKDNVMTTEEVDNIIRKNTGRMLCDLERDNNISDKDKSTIKHYINTIGKDLKILIMENYNEKNYNK
jgi:hypothetical protein